jgi:hypothetical protein
MDVFPGKYTSLPGKYLGLPLHYRNVKRIDLQPLIEKINNRLAGWKGKLLSKAGRETLVKSVLSAQPIYHLTVFPPQKWLLQTIDKMRRNFLWKGSNPEACTGGHCLINWPTTFLPKSKGGLGILDLDRFARGLRLRWLWLRWKSKDRAWTAMKLPCDKTDEDLFNASTSVTVGNGKIAEFWKSSWIRGQAPKNITPSLLSAFRTRGVPGPTSKLSPRAPAQMGRRETEHEGGGSRRETGVRGGILWPSCLSRAQVGCACSRGLQASTREGASGLTRAPSCPSPRGQPSVRGPWSFLL